MTPEGRSPHEWSHLAWLIDVLLDTPVEQRAERVRQLAGTDEARVAELEALLAELQHEPAMLQGDAAQQFPGLLEDPPELFPPSLTERYAVSKVLGRGGMATVFLARDLKHGRDVAVKVMHSRVGHSAGSGRFLREIQIVAQLRSPLIVPLYDSGEADGRLYFVMPYEPGLSLDRRLARDGPLPIAEAVDVLRDVCEALAHAHERGVVHRDIKPANVLLSGRHAVVSDFGVAKALADDAARTGLTGAGIMIGTPTYMAPEQISGDQVDHRTDIYAVGVLAYELLTARPPFAGDSHQEVLALHLATEPTPVANLRADVSAALASLVMKCLAKRPEDRWQSADELLQHLAAVAAPVQGVTPTRGMSLVSRAVAVVAVLGVATVAGRMWSMRGDAESGWRDRWAAARIERLTDFPGDEVDAAISADGRYVAFLADRDGAFDAYVTQIGSGQFTNLTQGRVAELFNEDVRNIGFSSDASQVWMRSGDITNPATVSVIPTLGGTGRTFINGAVMVAWSPDGSKIAYHQATTGDPIFIADPDGANARQIFIAAPGVHSHYLSWSPDSRFIYFSHGTPPNDMDIFRVPVTGGSAERITNHASRVAYPVPADDRTLLYAASDENGGGPWLYAMDLESRQPLRLSSGVERYLSISAGTAQTGQPRRFVATVSNPQAQLWSAAITDGVTDEAEVERVALPLERAAAPRYARDSSLWYLASRGGSDGIWRLHHGEAAEVWKPGEGSVTHHAAIAPDAQRVCVPVQRAGRTRLNCLHVGGADVTTPAADLNVKSAASFSPDGAHLAVAAADTGGVRIFTIPAGGGPSRRLVDSVSFNPEWSPDGRFIVYSHAPRGRSVSLAAVTPEGKPYPLPPLVVDRLGDSYRFLNNGKQLIVKLGGFRRQDFWLFDLATGAKRQLTRLRPGDSILRFDVSPDGQRIVFERVRANSDVVSIEVPSR